MSRPGFSDRLKNSMDTCINHKNRHTAEVHRRGRQRWYISSAQFGSGDLYIFLPYSMYTRKGKTYPVLFSLLHCKVAPPLSLISLPILSVSLLLWRHIPRGGAWDWKNSDLYYSLSHHGWIFNDDKKSCLILENCYKLLKHQQMIKNIFFAKNFIFFWFVYFLRINRQSPIILLLTKSLF